MTHRGTHPPPDRLKEKERSHGDDRAPTTRPVIVRGPSLVMSARVGAAIEPAVAEAEARARRGGVQVDPEVAAALDELHQLATWWRQRPVAAATPPGPDPVGPGADAEPIPDSWLDMAATAARMGCPLALLATACGPPAWDGNALTADGPSIRLLLMPTWRHETRSDV